MSRRPAIPSQRPDRPGPGCDARRTGRKHPVQRAGCTRAATSAPTALRRSRVPRSQTDPNYQLLRFLSSAFRRWSVGAEDRAAQPVCASGTALATRPDQQGPPTQRRLMTIAQRCYRRPAIDSLALYLVGRIYALYRRGVLLRNSRTVLALGRLFLFLAGFVIFAAANECEPITPTPATYADRRTCLLVNGYQGLSADSCARQSIRLQFSARTLAPIAR